MAWVLRGLREGVVTSRYPRRPDDYGEGFKAAVSVIEPTSGVPTGRPDDSGAGLAELCPTGAISNGSQVRVDRGLCILCGRCVGARPDRFIFASSPELATLTRPELVVPHEDDDTLRQVRTELATRVRALRRSIHVRHVDAGSDGSDEWEVAALTNPVYDVQRLGIFFTATPRHADVLLVTGVGTAGMAAPLRHTFEAMPDPKVVVAAGTDAVSGGIVHPSYTTGPGIASMIPVDVWIPGSPPSPFSLLHGILAGVGFLFGGRSA